LNPKQQYIRYNFQTTEERAALMSRIRGKNTRPELMLRKLLWNSGIRYRIYYNKLPGKPDLVITKYKLAVFVDGEFWHGYNWEEKKQKIKSNTGYWIPKIEKNMVRDSDTNAHLEYLGFRVMRFWQNEIEQNPAACFLKVIGLIEEIERKNTAEVL
jgi:DNA mismatch endonuclease, patch repair protein